MGIVVWQHVADVALATTVLEIGLVQDISLLEAEKQMNLHCKVHNIQGWLCYFSI